MKKLLIIGDGGHGKSVLDCALSMNIYDEIAFLINHDEKETDKRLKKYRIFEKEKTNLSSLREEYNNIVVAIGDNNLRIALMKEYKDAGFNLETLIHASASVSQLASIGEGSVILANASVNAFTSIGEGCIINTNANVNHDSVLEKGVHLSPGVSMGGNVHIGEKTWIGVGSSVRNKISIGHDTIIGMGSVVIKDIDSGVIAYGTPCKTVKKNIC